MDCSTDCVGVGDGGQVGLVDDVQVLSLEPVHRERVRVVGEDVREAQIVGVVRRHSAQRTARSAMPGRSGCAARRGGLCPKVAMWMRPACANGPDWGWQRRVARRLATCSESRPTGSRRARTTRRRCSCSREIHGLPVHPLAVHGAVVLVPLPHSWACSSRSPGREPGRAGRCCWSRSAAVVAVFVARQSGFKLKEHLAANDFPYKNLIVDSTSRARRCCSSS